MFFTIEARDGATYETNHLAPSYSERDHMPLLTFLAEQQFVTLAAGDVLNVRFHAVPLRKRRCPHCN